MTNQEKIQKIKRMREELKIPHKTVFCQNKTVGEKVRSAIGKAAPKIRTLIAGTTLGLVTFAPGTKISATTTGNTNISSTVTTESQNMPLTANVGASMNIGDYVESSVNRLWGDINRFCDVTQAKIKKAKKGGYRTRIVRDILKSVCPDQRFSGRENYCVAGALYVRKQCNDSILSSILPDVNDINTKTGSNPTTQCDAIMKYFDNTIGEHYASRKDKNFQTVIDNLEPGDIIIVRSRTNTTSGKHCVGVAGTTKNESGKVVSIQVRSFNNESNYSVTPNKVVGAANIIGEYRERLTNSCMNQNSSEKTDITVTADSLQSNSKDIHMLDLVKMKLAGDKLVR